MERKRQLRRLGLILIILGTAAVGVMIGAVVFLVNPDLVPQPTPPTEVPPTLAPAATKTPSTVWLVTFEHRFTFGPWETGRHSYTISADCPGAAGAGTWSGSVEVSGAAEIERNRIYLRANGVMNAPSGGERVARVNPEQTLGAAVTFSYPNLDSAESARASCDVTVVLDGGSPNRMEPALPKEQVGG